MTEVAVWDREMFDGACKSRPLFAELQKKGVFDELVRRGHLKIKEKK